MYMKTEVCECSVIVVAHILVYRRYIHSTGWSDIRPVDVHLVYFDGAMVGEMLRCNW